MNNNFKKGKVWEGEKMYMDSDIPIPEKLPQYIIDDLEHLQELYDSKEPNHDLLWGSLLGRSRVRYQECLL